MPFTCSVQFVHFVLQFLHSTSNEEKQSLIPVITRLLQLSQQERTFLQETIKGLIETLNLFPKSIIIRLSFLLFYFCIFL